MKKKLITSLIIAHSAFAFDMSGNFSIEGSLNKGLNLIENGAKSAKNSVSNVLNSEELKNLYNKLPNGSELLEKCKQSDKCNPYKFINVVKNSHLVKYILSKTPNLTIPEIGSKVNLVSNYVMDTYFETKKFTKIVNGLFVKKNYGRISDILIVSSNHDINAIKENILNKINNSQLKKEIESGNYMPLLWNMEIKSENKMDISIKPVADKNSKLAMNYKMKVKYQTHEEINIKHPKNSLQRKLISAYKNSLKKI